MTNKSINASNGQETLIVGGKDCDMLGICQAQRAGCTTTPCFMSKDKAYSGINSQDSTEKAVL